MEDVAELKYFETILCKYNNVESEVRDRAVKDRQLWGAQDSSERNVSMEATRGLRIRVILQNLVQLNLPNPETFGPKTCRIMENYVFQVVLI